MLRVCSGHSEYNSLSMSQGGLTRCKNGTCCQNKNCDNILDNFVPYDLAINWSPFPFSLFSLESFMAARELLSRNDFICKAENSHQAFFC